MADDMVVIYTDEAGEWRWHRSAPNGRIVADSGEGYKNLSDCVTAAREVNNPPYTTRFKYSDHDHEHEAPLGPDEPPEHGDDEQEFIEVVNADQETWEGEGGK